MASDLVLAALVVVALLAALVVTVSASSTIDEVTIWENTEVHILDRRLILA